jgi:hypothetical protein
MREKISIQMEVPLKEKLKVLACAERRSMKDEAICLIENGLEIFETQEWLNRENKKSTAGDPRRVNCRTEFGFSERGFPSGGRL